jgi:hypothetical protein
MLPRHVAILKANQGELRALTKLDSGTAKKVRPLFEIGRLTDAIRVRRYIQNSRNPTMTHLNRVLDDVGDVWTKRIAMVDGYHWPANAHTENGEHVIAYMVSRLRAKGMPVIPVVGYDRWGNEEYRLGMLAIRSGDDSDFCLRLDASAVEDAAEPEHFRETIQDILAELELDPTRCSILLDFADVSMNAMSVEIVVESSSNIIRQLRSFGFEHYTIAACSIPRSIDLAVSSRDATGMVVRKEMLTWQALQQSIQGVKIVSGDYGVRGPTTTEAPS